ncbi:MAG: 6-carboxytetrahydropterin synthase [Candidatus Zixiibacteriota bacterium]|jgi:6-pyruvoyltetrahydropterin/6-carboxytetrahydropterin synthase
MPYEIEVEANFSAAHALRGYGGACERLHGHNFVVIATARAEGLDEVGIGLDFKVFRAALGEVLEDMDHQNLNDLPDFRERNATAENVAAFIYARLAPKIETNHVRLARVTVKESPKYAASFVP